MLSQPFTEIELRLNAPKRLVGTVRAMDTNPRTPPSPLLRRIGDAARGVTRLLVIRVSARHVGKLKDNEETGVRLYADVPGVAELAGMSDNLFATDRSDLRAEHGVVKLRYCDLSSGSEQRSVFGYFLATGDPAAGDRLGVLAVMDSAADDNLPPATDDPSGLGRNAFTECVIELVVALDPTDVYVPFSSRWQRSERHSSRLAEVLRRQGCRFWVEGHLKDLTDPGVRLLTSIDGGKNEAELTEQKTRFFEKKVEKYRHDLWPRPEFELPPTHRLVREVRPDGTQRIVKGVTEVVPEYVEAVHAGMKVLVAGGSWEAVAAAAAAAPMRGTRSKGRMVADAHQPERSVESLFLPRNLEFWRTGVLHREARTSIRADKIRGIAVTCDNDTGFAVAEVSVRLPVPDDGFPWTADEVEAVEAELARRAAAPRRNPGPSSRLRPLSGAAAFKVGSDDDHQYRIASEGPSAYRLRRRPAQARGWDTGEGEHLATLYAPAMHRTLAQAIRDELRSITEPLAPLARPAEDRRRQRRQELTESRGDLVARLARVDDIVLGATTDADVKHWLARSQEVRDELAHVDAALERLDEDDDTSQRTVDAVLPAAIAELLERCGARPGDPVLNRAMERLGILDTLRATSWDAETVELAATLTLYTSSGKALVRHLEWRCPNSKPGRPDRLRARDLLRRFGDGSSFDDLATVAGGTPDETRTTMLRWLKDAGHVPSRGRRRALADCPVRATRNAVATHVLDGGADDPWASHVAEAYTARQRWPQAWRTDTHEHRQLLATLLTQQDPNDGIPARELAALVGVPVATVHTLARPDGPLEARPHDVVALRSCPHPDCPAAPGHRFASVCIRTPETAPWGALCPACGRLPDPTSTFRFPAEYLTAETAHQTLAAYTRLYSIGEAADVLGVATHRLRDWADRGLVTSRGRRDLTGGRAGRTFALADLEAARPLAARYRSRIDTTLFLPAEAGQRLGIDVGQVRRLEDIGVLTRVTDDQGCSGYTLRSIDTLPADALRLARDELLTGAAAARLVGVPSNMVTTAAANGELPAVQVGRCRYFEPAVVREWVTNRTPDPEAASGVPIGAVAAAAGVSTAVVRNLTDAGKVPCLGRVGRHRRYDLAAAVEAVRRARPTS